MWELTQRISIGSSPTPTAGTMAEREAKLWVQRGQNVVFHDLPCPMQGAWAVREHRCRWGVFWEENSTGLKRYCFDHRGVRLREIPEMKLFTNQSGIVERKTLSGEDWAEAVADESLFGLRLRRPRISVEGEPMLKAALGQVLEQAGFRVEKHWRAGVPAFWLEQGGFSLAARDERGAVVDSGQLLSLVTLIEMENGGRKVALPPWSSVSARLVAMGHGGQVLELEEPEGRELYAALPWLREGSSAAVRIGARMAASGQSLERLVSVTPRFQQWKREDVMEWDRERVLAGLRTQGSVKNEAEGFQLRVRQSWIHVRPVKNGRVQVMAEGADMEAAEELCDMCLRRLTQREQ